MKNKAFILITVLLLFVKFTQAQIFTEQTDIVIPGISRGSVDWGDYNNDGLLDFMLTGIAEVGYYSALYLNNGNDMFLEYTEIIEDVQQSCLDWGDYNNDNYLDIVLTGERFENSTNNYYTKIYKNNTYQSFTEQTNHGLYITTVGNIYWGDYSSDAYNDIFQSGFNLGDIITKIYKNNKNNTFIDQTANIYIEGVWYGSMDWGDYNNDGYLDFVYTGTTIENKEITEIYKNNGDNSFSIQNEVVLPGVVASSSEWGDFNNDGYIDLLISGEYPTKNDKITKIFKNNGDETFTELYSDLAGVFWSSVVWGDYDNDGLSDILLSGIDIEFDRISKIYKNNGDNVFIEQTEISLAGVGYSSVAWGDYDNDNDLDIILTGFNNLHYISKIYKNNTTTPNSPPNIITNLQTEIKDSTVYFRWDEATDNNQPSAGLSYNIYVYNEDNRENILSGDTAYEHQFVASPQAFIQNHSLNGKRLLAQRGHIQGIRKDGRVTYFLRGVFENCKTYYWSVQAIDASFAGGEFASEVSFVFDNILPEITCPENFSTEIPVGQTIYTVIGTELDPVSYSDNCGTVNIENNSNLSESLQGAEFTLGTTTVEWTATDSVGNQTQCNFDVEVKNPTRLNDISENRIVISPNPSKGIFTIITNNQYSIINNQLIITDITGKTIRNIQYSIINNQYSIDLKNHPKGIYFLTISNTDYNETFKLIIY